MSCVRCVSVAVIAAAASLLCCLGVSAAPAWAGDVGAQTLLFSGADLWRDGQFLHGGLLWSPGGLDREGFTLKTMISGGRYHYISGALNNARIAGTEAEVQALPGWRFKRGRLEVKFFAGVDIKNNSTSPYDPSSRLQGTSFGVRGTTDLWYEPTFDTMIAANASLTSIANGYSVRLAYGWRLLERYYLGPEAQTFACDGYRQFRFGVHLTGLKTNAWEWSAAAGWADDSERRPSFYLRLGILTRR